MPNESRSVLLVEEYKLVADYLTKELVRRGMVVHVPEELTAESVIAKAEESQPDATLVDLRLTERDVPGIIDPLVAMGSGVVLVAGESDRKVLGESLVRGATGFVSKADDPERVVEAIEDTIAGRPVLSPAVREPLIAEVLTARELESRELAAFEDLTEREHLVLWYLVLGHLAGDFTLRELVSLVKEAIRKEELFARYGGEEFVVVLPETTREGAQQMSERLRQLVENHPFQYEERRYNITVSLGLVSTEGDESLTPNDLIKLADDKLYQAKREGRNRVVA